MYKWSNSETGRACILSRTDLNMQIPHFNTIPDKFEQFGYETCWIQLIIPQKPLIMLCSFYRQPGANNTFIHEFENEIILAKTKHLL